MAVMNTRIIILAIIAMCVASSLMGQDSIPVQKKNLDIKSRQWVTPATIGIGYAAIGVVSDASKKNWEPIVYNKENTGIVDIVQYAPIALPWGMKICGEPTRSGWGRMAVSHGASAVIMAGTVSLIKDNHASLRPDASDYRSFPSGHTAWAYMGATAVANELGWRSPWYTIGAYSVASAVAMQRVIDRRHLPSDVMAGAGIGIVATQLGYVVGDLIFKDKQIENCFDKLSTDNENIAMLSLVNTFSVPMNNHINVANVALCLLPAFEVGIKGYLPLYENWYISAVAAMRSTPIFVEMGETRAFVSPLNDIGMTIMPGYRMPLSEMFSLNTEIGCGYKQCMYLKSIDRDISAGNGCWGGKINVGVMMRLSEEVSVEAAIGYEISQYEYSVSKSEQYNIVSDATKSGVLNVVNIGLATQIAF